ncbi:molecular chaperone TorD family protein [Geobacter sp. FeAm09]|uniref:TorD/DmsD family molecular chaperone n=1 Tax=Geobacter sp. FeAm09 TaxID=2597769 RepID=UPI0011EEFB03|nr:molecular chaperone TorD family protein [Geobacter sp. FeAm09]QEM67676.1 molecular chaperone TorD family protein [Geobacter sp. FeAm09]
MAHNSQIDAASQNGGDMYQEQLNFEGFMRGRIAIYSTLSMLFGEFITYDRMALLHEIVCNYLRVIDIPEDRDELASSSEKLGSWLTVNKDRKNDEAFNLDLAREHTAFFALGKYKVPDTASATLSNDRLVKREQWEKCRRFYQKFGFKMKDGSTKYDDCFDVQCLFMESLIEKTLSDKDDQNIMKLLNAQVEFLDGHVLNWIGVFGRNLKNKAQDGSIYQAIAMIPKVLVKIDRENISELIAA